MKELQDAIMVAQSGEREKARHLFSKLVSKTSRDPAIRCILAHYMADVQDSPAEELSWDLDSLNSLDQVKDQYIDFLGNKLKTSGFYASIYLNIANDYRKNEDRDNFLKFVRLAEESCSFLENNEYGSFVRNRISLLAKSR